MLGLADDRPLTAEILAAMSQQAGQVLDNPAFGAALYVPAQPLGYSTGTRPDEFWLLASTGSWAMQTARPHERLRADPPPARPAHALGPPGGHQASATDQGPDRRAQTAPNTSGTSANPAPHGTSRRPHPEQPHGSGQSQGSTRIVWPETDITSHLSFPPAYSNRAT